MNRVIIVLIISVLFIKIDSLSQSNDRLIPYLKNGKYGFVNESGKLIIKPQYSFALPFYKGNQLTTVVKRSKPNIINREGKIILKNASSDFFQSTPISSMQIIPYTSVEPIAIEKHCNSDSNHAFFLISTSYKKDIFDKIKGFYIVNKENKVFLIDTKGNVQSKLYDRIQHFNNKMIEYCIVQDLTNNKYGLLNHKAKEVLRCIYDEIVYEGSGKFSVSLAGTQRNFSIPTKGYTPCKFNQNKNTYYQIKRKNKKLGIVNKFGKVIVQNKFDYLYQLNKNRFVFVKSDSVGIMDINEKPFYLQIKQNTDIESRKYAIINKNIVFFKNNNKWKLVDLSGRQLGNSYDGIFVDLQHVMTGTTGVINNNKLGVINHVGKLIIENCDTIYGLRENGSFVVKKGNRWHWLNSKGDYIYKDFSYFNYIIENYLLVYKNQEWFYVNEEGIEFK